MYGFLLLPNCSTNFELCHTILDFFIMDEGSSYPVGFYPEDWMDIPADELGMNVISPLRVTNTLQSVMVLTINVEENEPEVLEAARLDRVVEAQPVASTS